MAALSAPGAQPSGEWAEVERIRDLPAVDDAIRNFLIDSTGNNSTCMVREVLRAAGVTACHKGKGDCVDVLPDKRCFGCPANAGVQEAPRG